MSVERSAFIVTICVLAASAAAGTCVLVFLCGLQKAGGNWPITAFVGSFVGFPLVAAAVLAWQGLCAVFVRRARKCRL